MCAPGNRAHRTPWRCAARVAISIVLVGCGRLGFDNLDAARLDTLGTIGDDGGLDSGALTDAPVCLTEMKLASATNLALGNFSGTHTQLALALSPSSQVVYLGLSEGLTSGFTGSRDFRSPGETMFAAVVAPLMAGSDTQVDLGIFIPSSGGQVNPKTPSAPLSGLRITMVRRIVNSLTFGPDGGGGTDHSYDATWEFWGCMP